MTTGEILVRSARVSPGSNLQAPWPSGVCKARTSMPRFAKLSHLSQALAPNAGYTRVAESNTTELRCEDYLRGGSYAASCHNIQGPKHGLLEGLPSPSRTDTNGHEHSMGTRRSERHSGKEGPGRGRLSARSFVWDEGKGRPGTRPPLGSVS
jgi:hypothetical protein